jgi:putative flippase GtrA
MTTLKRTLPYPVWLEQAAKFLSVGILNTAIDASLYFMLTRWLGLSTLQTLAKGISYGAGILNSFYWNKSWTFKSDAGTMTAFAPFVVANLAALAINAGIMHLCLNALALHEMPSLALATGVTFLWNFIISKFVVFKK